ncbi:MAG: DUF1957 domain-containing protein [Polyangiales bacterium]
MTEAALSLVLHAHLPWVRHPEHDDALEERWLFEAIHESYLPLLTALQRLARDGVAPRVALSLSPPLLAMLRDALLRARFARHLDKLDRLIAAARRDRRFDAAFTPALDAHARAVASSRELWRALGGDLVSGFVDLAREGVELFTTALTHAWLPGLRHHPAVARAQVRAGLREFREATGLHARGFWLPECGWLDGVDGVLVDEGVRWTVLEAHGVLHATPAPRWGLARPSRTRAGLAVFGRDPEASRAVWSREVGYPSDTVYRDFHADAGFTLPEDALTDFTAADGTRQFTGLKPWRVTGHEVKEPWDPAAAFARAQEHAERFVRDREAWARWTLARGCEGATSLCPYDAELFGHWWCEGPAFVEAALRHAARSDVLTAMTPSECLDRWRTDAVVSPSSSTWGEGGFGAVWLSPEVAWSLRPTERACAAVESLVRAGDRRFGRASRELSLALSSDWAFLARSSGYALGRWRGHLAALNDVLRGVDESPLSVGRDRPTESPRPWPSLTPADFFTEDER